MNTIGLTQRSNMHNTHAMIIHRFYFNPKAVVLLYIWGPILGFNLLLEIRIKIICLECNGNSMVLAGLQHPKQEKK